MPHFTVIPTRTIPSLIALLFFGPIVPSFAQQALGVKEADELVVYATRLAIQGDAVKIGEGGLTITGATLSGEAVRRPSDALARAAEIYAEAAKEEGSTRMMSKALGLWKRIAKPEFAIPYLRLYSRNAQDSRNPFALFCHIQLAQLYESIGDVQSADEIYVNYLDYEPSEILEVYAVASASERLLELKRVDEATRLAQAAILGCDPTSFTHEPGGNGYTLAMNVLKNIPGAKIPTLEASNKQEAANAQTDPQLLASNPRKLIAEGNLDYRLGNYPAAIEKWQKYLHTFPNEDRSRQLALKIGKTYEKIKQMDQALEAYSLIEARYPKFPEWWQAVTAKAEIMETGGKAEEAAAYLQLSLKNSQTPESAAQLTLALAELNMRRAQADDAVTYYLTLMTDYADQDASRSALKNLLKTAPRSKDWKRLATGIKKWFSDNFALGSRSEFKNLSVTDAARIRRLVLSFYFKNDEVKQGARWLTEIRSVSDQTHQEYINRDEAWLYASGALSIAQNKKVNPSTRVLRENIDYGLTAWTLAPNTEEGLMGLKAAYILTTSRFAPKKSNKDVEEKLLELMKEEETKEEAYTMLLGYYEFLDDKKSLQDLKRRDLEKN